MVAPLDVLKEGFAELCRSEDFSDCKLKCGIYEYNLHKVVLSSQSAYFKLAFKADSFKEGESGVIELKAQEDDTEAQDDVCDDPEIVKLMIEYFYHFDYNKGCDCSSFWSSSWNQKKKSKKRTQLAADNSASIPPSSTPAVISPDSMLVHAKVFAMAVKYQVDGLRDLAVSKFTEAVKAGWDHESFAHTIFTVYNSTTDDATDLREIVADTIFDHFEALKNKDEVEVVVSSTGGLAYNLLKRSNTMVCKQKNHQEQVTRTVRCRACDSTETCCSYCYNNYNPRCTKCGGGAQRT